ncbi:TrkH family potassium uptake protein [Aurantimicrobium minutum]|uniref:TrkH family potassium uptake protein n=1 Tax=Aurantimicrobium minutum TaxID=708131 RepID=UPI00247672CD|nr:potassium transporter TrkG [Aurantimicrobium minutum]
MIREAIEAFASRSPSRFAILVFAAIIALFTILLSLPAASADGTATNFPDAFFTATSMVCVAGLTTVDMATHWSPLGNAFVFLATQIGALGVLTLASILGAIIAGRLGLRARLMAASDTNPLRLHAGPVAEGQAIRLGEIGGLLATVAISALVIEVGVAIAVLPSVLATGYGLAESLWYSIFYSAMAFTNTGVTPNVEGLTPFAHDYWFLLMLMFGVTLGSIGFPVLYALSRNFRRRAKWSLHVKLTIVAWSALWILGTIAFLLLEQSNGATFRNMNPGEQVFQSGFMSTMARSGGFALIPTSELDSASLFLTDMLMFIGGGSASTAGGIKVTTIAVLLLAAFAEARGRSSIEIFQRRIPGDVLRLAVSVLLWGAVTVALATIVLLTMTDAPFEFVLFDVISGFGTVGLSTGVTANLPDPGVYLMALVMFMGRVGTVTLAAALAVTQKGQLFTRPEERPIVG